MSAAVFYRRMSGSNSDTTRRSVGRRAALKGLAAVGAGTAAGGTPLGRVVGVANAAPTICSTGEVGTNCSSGGDGYPVQSYAHTDVSNGDMVSGVSEFAAYGSSAVCNWKIPVEVSSNASRPFCDCGTADEIEQSAITVTWDSTQGDVYSDTTSAYVGATQEQYPDSSFNYEDYADTAVDYGVNKLLDLVPYASEPQAALGLLEAMYESTFGSKNGSTDTWDVSFDWNNITYEVNQVSYWNKFEAILDPSASMDLTIKDKSDADEITGHRMVHTFDWPVTAPDSCPSSVIAATGGDSVTTAKTSDWYYVTVPRPRVEANPAEYGLTQGQLDRSPGERIIFAQRKSVPKKIDR